MYITLLLGPKCTFGKTVHIYYVALYYQYNIYTKQQLSYIFVLVSVLLCTY